MAINGDAHGSDYTIAKPTRCACSGARLERNLTQQQLANLIGKQQKTISAIENGSEGTKLDTLLSVIAILDLDLQVVSRRKDGKDITDVF
jgi:HTH-type transcriptional regulator/antitoxin HipB